MADDEQLEVSNPRGLRPAFRLTGQRLWDVVDEDGEMVAFVGYSTRGFAQAWIDGYLQGLEYRIAE